MPQPSSIPANLAYLTVGQVAARLQVSDSLIYQAIAEGRLQAIRLSGNGKRGTYRVTQEALDTFIAASTVQQHPSEEPEAPLRHVR
jgi:excisionase family DNA binding protein